MLGLVRAMRYHGHAKLRLPSASLSLPAAPLCLAPCGSRSNSRGSLLSEVSLRMDGHTGLTWECFLFSGDGGRAGERHVTSPARKSCAWRRSAPVSSHHLGENGTFLSFPYVCPEPVLVKC